MASTFSATLVVGHLVLCACSGTPTPTPPSDWHLAAIGEYPTHVHPWELATHDLNADGIADLVVGGGGVTVLLGSRTGVLVPASLAPFGGLTNAIDFAFGDFDGDERIDFVVADHDAPQAHFALFLATADGVYAHAQASPFGVRAVPHLHTVAALDANGDGSLDVVADSWPESRLVLVTGRGDGTFDVPGEPFAVPQVPMQNLRSADLNADGFGDIVTPAHDARALSVLLGDGDGGFTLAPGAPLSTMGGFTTVEVADIDLDGDTDVVAVHRSDASTEFLVDGLSVLLNDGRGHLTHARGSPLKDGLPQRSNALAIGDLDGDGLPEIVVLGETHRALALVRIEPSGMRVAGTFVTGEDCRGVALADVDEDGKCEVLVSDRGKGVVRVLE